MLSPLGVALFWSVVAGIVFEPLHRLLHAAFGGRRNISALAATSLVVLIVILPLMGIAASLVGEATGAYDRLRAGPLDLSNSFRPMFDRLPDWIRAILAHLGLARLDAVQDKVATIFADSLQWFAAQAYSVGQGTFELLVGLCIMLYGLFFLLRDGKALSRRIGEAIPLRPSDRDALLGALTSAVRATVAGDFLVALVQGALGGLIFWILGIHSPLLWAALMAILSLLPAIGAALVWLPVALYFLATGDVWQGLTLIVFGLLVIGLIDNLLRPILVGEATKLPDYLVLISTIGGIEVFGLQGFIVGPVVAAMFVEVWRLQSAKAPEAAVPSEGTWPAEGRGPESLTDCRPAGHAPRPAEPSIARASVAADRSRCAAGAKGTAAGVPHDPSDRRQDVEPMPRSVRSDLTARGASSDAA